jgi:hypothetical protein
MIIISVIEDKIHIAPLLKDKTIDYERRAVINAGAAFSSAAASLSLSSVSSSSSSSSSSPVAEAAVAAAAAIFEARQKIIAECGARLFSPDGAAAVFIDERRCYFAALKDPQLDDKIKLDEYIKWNIKQNCNIDDFEYSCAGADDGFIYASAVCAKRIAAVKGAMARFADKIICADTHLFNEVNYLRRSGFINNDDNDFALLKLCGDYVSIIRFLPDAGFERFEFDFMCKPLLCDYKNDQSGYGAQELMLMHELVKKISKWQSRFPAPRQKPKKLLLLNAAGGEAPYYLRLRITEELSDNLYYVNLKKENAAAAAFDYITFNLEAMCDRWR